MAAWIFVVFEPNLNLPDFNAAADRVLARCDALAECTEQPGELTRRFLTPAMRAAHDRVAEWMLQGGLTSQLDGAGNLIGCRRTRAGRRTLVIGSHLDTVPNAGRYDGILGVLIGIAVAELTTGHALPFDLEVVGFSEEEGVRFDLPFIGSSAFVGEQQAAWLDRVDSQGLTMRQVVSEYGLEPERIARAAHAEGEVLAFLEPHLEQGPVLWNSGMSVGVVSAIFGQTRATLKVSGCAGHAGTTPMAGRRDALAAAAEFVLAAHNTGLTTDGLRVTVGQLQVEPNVANVIPGVVRFSLDVRHTDDAIRREAVEELISTGERLAGERGCSFELVDRIEEPSVQMDATATGILSEAVAACGYRVETLISGAGHDAMVVARRFPTAMLFLRHPGAISHHPDERVDRQDVVVAIEVACRFVQLLADRVLSENAKTE
jgi:allantoate deiminase